MQLHGAIQKVQDLGREYNFDIIMVGGAMVRLIGTKTKIKKIDSEKRIITLSNVEDPSTIRPEDNKTSVDIDCIAFSNSEDPFTKKTRQDFSRLRLAVSKLRELTHFPAVSLEPVLYHPYFPKPKSLTQFVSSIESYHDHDFFFRLGSVKQDIKTSSLAFWTYVLSDTQKVVSLSPVALQYRYRVRGFAIKPKDEEKIWNDSPFARFAQEFVSKTKLDIAKEFAQWEDFIHAVQTNNNPSMRIKRTLWKTYWQTIGTYLAHGTGLIGKVLLPLGNTFFAGK